MNTKKITLNLPWAYALLTAASLAVTFFMFFIQANTGTPVWALIRESYGLTWLLNWLPVWFVSFMLFMLCGNLVAACGITALAFILLSVVNRYMIAMRWAPLRPFDLLLGMEFVGIARSIRPVVFITAGVGVVLFVLLFVGCLKLLKNNKPRWWFRLAGFVLAAAAFVALNRSLYTSETLNARLPYQGSAYNETDQYQSKGFAYSFLYALNTSRIIKPAYYDQYRGTVEAADADSRTRLAIPQEGLPNIIMVLSEAFSEMPMSPYIDFDGYLDPMQHYKDIKSESLNGFIVSPHIGGGTSDTEFDILTGLNTRDFRGVPYAFSMITRPFPGFTAGLKWAGYTAVGQHPGAGWFYNRQNVYPLLGFDAFYSDSAYDTRDTRGMYITERQTIDKIISTYQSHLDESPGTPFFLDCIAIQNHGPYNGKYSGTEKNFNTRVSLSADDEDALANYFEGMADCDRELNRLVDALRSVDAPTVLVYYGDHLPSFSPSVYQSLIPEPENAPPGEQLIRYNRLPFIIWANEAAQGMLDTESFSDLLPPDKTISASYLGAAVLEMVGLTGTDPLMDLLNDMRGDYPVVLEKTWRDSGGIMHEFDPDEAPALALYRCWAYYRLRHG